VRYRKCEPNECDQVSGITNECNNVGIGLTYTCERSISSLGLTLEKTSRSR